MAQCAYLNTSKQDLEFSKFRESNMPRSRQAGGRPRAMIIHGQRVWSSLIHHWRTIERPDPEPCPTLKITRLARAELRAQSTVDSGNGELLRTQDKTCDNILELHFNFFIIVIFNEGSPAQCRSTC